MKMLFSHYQFIINELSQLAFHLGFKGNLSLYFCQYLKLRGRPLKPQRSYISRKEMLKLYNFAYNCWIDITYFHQVICSLPGS